MDQSPDMETSPLQIKKCNSLALSRTEQTMLNKLQPNLINLIPDLFSRPDWVGSLSLSCPSFVNETRPAFQQYSSPQHEEVKSPVTQISLNSPTRPQFLTHSQMIHMMQDSALIPEDETSSLQVPSNEQSLLKSEQSLMKSSDRLEDSDDLMYSRSNFYEEQPRLSKVDEQSEEHLSSISELDDSTPTKQTSIINNLSIVHSRHDPLKETNLLTIERCNIELEQNNMRLSTRLSTTEQRVHELQQTLQVERQRVHDLEKLGLERESRLNQQKKEIITLKRQGLELELQLQYRTDQVEEQILDEQQKAHAQIVDLNRTLAQLQERYKSELNLKEEMLCSLQNENEQMQTELESIQRKFSQQIGQLKREMNEAKELDKHINQFLITLDPNSYHLDLKSRLRSAEEQWKQDQLDRKNLLEAKLELERQNTELRNSLQDSKPSKSRDEDSQQFVEQIVYNQQEERKQTLVQLQSEITSVKELRTQLTLLLGDRKVSNKVKELQDKVNEMSIQLLLERQDKAQQATTMQKELMNAHQREMDLQQIINEKQNLLDEQYGLGPRHDSNQITQKLPWQPRETIQKTDRDFETEPSKEILAHTKLLLDIKQYDFNSYRKQSSLNSHSRPGSQSKPQSLQTSPKLSIYEQHPMVRSPAQTHKKSYSMYPNEQTVSPDGTYPQSKKTKLSLIDENIQKLMEKFKGTQQLQSQFVSRQR